jgi:hypothetical protein
MRNSNSSLSPEGNKRVIRNAPGRIDKIKKSQSELAI